MVRFETVDVNTHIRESTSPTPPPLPSTSLELTYERIYAWLYYNYDTNFFFFSTAKSDSNKYYKCQYKIDEQKVCRVIEYPEIKIAKAITSLESNIRIVKRAQGKQ